MCACDSSSYCVVGRLVYIYNPGTSTGLLHASTFQYSCIIMMIPRAHTVVLVVLLTVALLATQAASKPSKLHKNKKKHMKKEKHVDHDKAEHALYKCEYAVVS